MKNIKICPVGGKIRINFSASGNPKGSIVKVLGYAFAKGGGRTYYDVSLSSHSDENPLKFYVCESIIPGGNSTIPRSFMNFDCWHEYIEENSIVKMSVDNVKIL